MAFIGRAVAPAPISSNDVPDLPASKITSGTIASARISEASVTQHASDFDDNKIVNDISTLALKQATNENAVAYNTNSQFIDVFQDSTGIASNTDAPRNASEYVSAQSTAIGTTNFIPQFKQISTRTGVPANSSHSGDNGTNDMIPNGVSHSGGYNYAGIAINEAWDLSQDFKFRAWIHTESLSAGSLTSMNFVGADILLTPNTSGVTAGSTPSGVFNSPANLSLLNPTASEWATNVLDGSYASTAGITSSTSRTNYSYNTVSGSAQSVSAGGANKIVSGYWNGGESTLYSGWEIQHTKSTNTILMRLYDAGSSTNISSHMPITITNVPSSGRAFIIVGHAFGLARYYSTSKVGGSTSSGNNSQKSGSVTTVPATGNFISNAITASASTNKMGAIITYQDNAGTNALNTDIVLQLSADGGSNFTTATLTALPDFSTGIKMCKVNDLTIGTAGTSLKYKLSFANQSAGSKEARIRGVSLQY